MLGQHKFLDGVPEMKNWDVILLRLDIKILLTLENCFADQENDEIPAMTKFRCRQFRLNECK